MKLFIGPKSPVQIAAPAALASGEMFLAGFGVWIAGAAVSSGDQISCDTAGAFEVPCLATDTPALFAKLYFDATNKRLTTTSSGNTLCALCLRAKTNGETTVRAWFPGWIV